MFLFRNVDRSVLKRVESLFTSPPAGTLSQAWNTYREDSFFNGSFTPTYPYIWVLDERVRPRQSRLPLVIIERGPTPRTNFELGNRGGHTFIYALHVFGRNRGERKDLAAFLEGQLSPIGIYDFATTPETLLYSVAVDDSGSSANGVAADVGIEGALAQWETVTISFLVKE